MIFVAGAGILGAGRFYICGQIFSAAGIFAGILGAGRFYICGQIFSAAGIFADIFEPAAVVFGSDCGAAVIFEGGVGIFETGVEIFGTGWSVAGICGGGRFDDIFDTAAGTLSAETADKKQTGAGSSVGRF